MKLKMSAELNAGIDLAVQRGSFPDYSNNLEFNEFGIPQSSFYKMLQEEFPHETFSMQKLGRRNINWSTVAPAGTVSLLAQTTSGCEPCFKVEYIRRRKVEKSSTNVAFIDQNEDSWEEYKILHPKYKIWSQLHNKSDESPYHNATANEIDWEKRIKIQSILQKYTTSAISSTINLPEDVSQEEVDKIYMRAWELGLKGNNYL
jgi:ribonucleoside-diphosphate reductase alpha chain